MMKTMRSQVQFFLFFLSWLVWQPAASAQNAAPNHPVDGKFISEWLLLGPLPDNNLSQDFLSPAGSEAAAAPFAGDALITAQGDTLRWQRWRSEAEFVDFQNIFGEVQNATAYAFCTLQSKKAGAAQVLLGSDDGAAVWLNGERIHNSPSASKSDTTVLTAVTSRTTSHLW